MHSDVQHMTGTSVTVTGLTPLTLYQIHVHPLPHGAHAETSTKLILIVTLAQGAAAQPVATADYTTCNWAGLRPACSHLASIDSHVHIRKRIASIFAPFSTVCDRTAQSKPRPDELLGNPDRTW